MARKKVKNVAPVHDELSLKVSQTVRFCLFWPDDDLPLTTTLSKMDFDALDVVEVAESLENVFSFSADGLDGLRERIGKLTGTNTLADIVTIVREAQA